MYTMQVNVKTIKLKKKKLGEEVTYFNLTKAIRQTYSQQFTKWAKTESIYSENRNKARKGIYSLHSYSI
jgi:hypothetical protein